MSSMRSINVNFSPGVGNSLSLEVAQIHLSDNHALQSYVVGWKRIRSGGWLISILPVK